MRNPLFLVACLSGVSLICCSVEGKKNILVTCQTVETTTIVDSSEFVGSIEAKSQATISAENEGIISQILVKPGESVIAGTSLFLLDNSSQIKTPISGLVSNILVNRGEFITRGQVLTSIVNNQTLELNVGVPTERSSQLKMGLPVEIIDSSRNVSLKSRINFISPEVNRNSQSILAKATVYNNGSFRDNQFVRARVIWSERPGVLIPTTVISRVRGQSFVFVATGQKSEAGEVVFVAKQRLVVLGDIQGKAYQMVSGLEAGEKVVGSEILNLSDGVPIKCRDNKSES